MEFGVQIGHGMQAITERMLKKWGGGTVVLSPRNSHASKNATAQEQLISYAKKIRKLKGALLLDPQLFSTKTPSKNLADFSFCQACAGDLYAHREKVVRELVALNDRCGTREVILPSVTTGKADERWASLQKHVMDEASLLRPDDQLFATVALDADGLKNLSVVENVIREAEGWRASGVYLVFEHPGGDYLVNQPLWLLNMMQLVAGLKLVGKKVYVGYGSHQMLLLSLAKCDAVFSGSFLNVRRFQTSTFEQRDDDSPSKRVKWYYAPQAFSEFKLTSLDIAHQGGFLDVLKTPYDDEEFVGVLFGDALPTDTAYSESDSFCHYLHSLREQCVQFSRSSYQETLDSYRLSLQTSEYLVSGLKSQGIYDKDRNFAEALPANNQALSAFDSNFGHQMGWEWGSL